MAAAYCQERGGGRHPRPDDPTLRTFPYRYQATVLAEYTETDLRIVRVYFAGQDWLG